MVAQGYTKIDFSELKANQGMIFLLNLLAILFNLPVLSVFAALITGMGYLFEVSGFFALLSISLAPAWVAQARRTG